MTKLADIATTAVSRIDRRQIITVEEDALLIEVVGLLFEHRRGAVVVLDGTGGIAGIFTEHDLIAKINHASLDWHRHTVSQYMTRGVKSITTSTSIAEAIGLMSAGGFRHLPVTDGDGTPVGLLSIRDIIVHIAHHYPQEFMNLPPDPHREASSPWGG